MNSYIDNDDALIALYRAGSETIDGLDSETLLAWIDGNLSAERQAAVAALLAASPAARSLLDMLMELKPDSVALASAVTERQVAHHGHGRREQRRVAAAPARRVARWTSAVAACAMVAVAVFAFHGARHPASAPVDAASDRIFSMQEDRIFDWTPATHAGSTQAAGSDRVFISGFANKGS